MKGLIQIIVKFRAQKFCVCSNHQTSFWGAWYISYTKTTVLKMKKGSFHFIATQFGSWFLKKNITRCTFLHRGTCKHQKSQRNTHKICSVLNTFTAKGFSETRPFMYLGKHVFRSQELQKYLSNEAHFFSKYSKFNVDSKNAIKN